jgi:hypothetical protein
MRLLQMVYHIGPPGSLTKLVKMLVWWQSGTRNSRTGHCPTTNCCLGQCWTLFSPCNTKCSNIIPYSAQKTQSGPWLRVAHYLTRYSITSRFGLALRHSSSVLRFEGHDFTLSFKPLLAPVSWLLMGPHHLSCFSLWPPGTLRSMYSIDSKFEWFFSCLSQKFFYSAIASNW